MWCRNILRTCTTHDKPTTFACLHFLTNNNFNDVTLKYPAGYPRLLALNACERTIGDVIDQWSRRFENDGIPEPIESIMHIVAHVIGTKKVIDVENAKNNRLNVRQIEKLESLCQCRLCRMPVQYIIGEWDFRDITLKLEPPIFIPRPETEILVDYLLKRLSSSHQTDNCEVLEIGCGSGAISLALAHACKIIKCTAVDANPHACDLTVTNRNKLNLTEQVTVINAILNSDASIEVLGKLNGAGDTDLNSRLFDFVVSNPPYITSKGISKLQPEIKIYEDLIALDGGDDGLKVIKPLLKYAAKVLKPGGRLFMEVDYDHPKYIQFFTNKYSDLKLHHEHTYKDFNNIDRFVEVVKVS
ncbi:MTRF1L release factor glutamine methyltransferase [Monomorium pharaonis]|uniref:MTRF1L release factor glutamine methyltransferase n=1 Tax=Monomorium pharaonis TaxID=307658 RepID=UPI00063EF417|nr:MTRF1L release factor glutamine methyltransferase [Monomorium pharaonis]